MKREQKITINWWMPTANSNEEVPAEYEEALAESGFARAWEMAAEGFSSGELSDNVRIHDEPEDGIEFLGSWEIETLDVEGE